jgi:monofunctional biosynthetic peptidoglycan transglycosylase
LKTRRRVFRTLAFLAAVGFWIVVYVYLTLPDVRVLAATNPTNTAWMELRAAEAAREGRTVRQVQRWVPYSRISNQLKRAVLVAEDSAFWDHEGVDLEQIRESIRVNWEQGRAIRGASTITQQLAKNLYLSPSRDPLRKLRELIIARRLEAALPKARIFEIYLNVIEWGDGIWGVEAASRTYFGTPASAVSRDQAALLAGAIINPRVLNPRRPTARLYRRQKLILGRMRDVTPPAPAPVAVAVPESVSESTPEDVSAPIDSGVGDLPGLTVDEEFVIAPPPVPSEVEGPESASPEAQP